MRRLPALLLFVAAIAQAEPAVVEQPRGYGYLVGDVLVQRVLLAAGDHTVELPELPRKERIGVWLVRRDAKLETRAGQRWLVLDYQIVNASKDLDTFALPALHLRTQNGAQTLDVPEWPISVGAITGQAVREQGELVSLQPDRPAPMIDTARLARRLMQSIAALALSLALWAGWFVWRNWQAARRQPFARAQRELRRLDSDSEAAWRCLHRAFDATAGRVVQPAALPALFERAPAYTPLRREIEQFFAASAARFFGGAAAAPPLRPLCARLRAIERRAEP